MLKIDVEVDQVITEVHELVREQKIQTYSHHFYLESFVSLDTLRGKVSSNQLDAYQVVHGNFEGGTYEIKAFITSMKQYQPCAEFADKIDEAFVVSILEVIKAKIYQGDPICYMVEADKREKTFSELQVNQKSADQVLSRKLLDFWKRIQEN